MYQTTMMLPLLDGRPDRFLKHNNQIKVYTLHEGDIEGPDVSAHCALMSRYTTIIKIQT